jgi:C1A family cysteine protease
MKMSLLSVSEIKPLLSYKRDWLDDLPPIKNQGYCGNCWAHSIVTMMEGMVNRYTPANIKEEWAKRDDNPFKNGLVTLSVKQMTECTDYNWLQQIKDSSLFNMDHLD